ncbi:flagellar basal body P-ring formation chaperone FlgA [Pseudomonas flexibilis]|uniref:Flagella basal body P-ring formation protein FlgA n=1 Tax=Pseudomonas flexibilis TaxID=706570 RepID=A0A0B3BNY6_9PSED|nr:flagellar basal body P-ring formation chaperone FlgA [Pseudomonas flexibilis]KHO66183.1 flagellar basal body P-ring biosynthesis protein FlgA [Pseudomonas flexibilis]SCY45670.1 flagella basal body P-ring formation protein FlgA [Pseudomonas flexibilis]
MILITTVFRRLRGLGLALATTAALQIPAVAGAAAQTLPEHLIGATEAFLEEQVANYLQRASIGGRYEIQVNRLDSRLRMPACDQPLVASLESPAQPVGRVTVRVGCQGSSTWSLFVPAQVRLFRQVVVAQRPLARGAILEAQDIDWRERDVGTLTQGYLTEPEQALGSKLTRPVSIDQVLTPNHLERAPVVRKGDHVVISAGGAALSVRMPGEALQEGAIGEQVRVRNLSSQRIIKARISGPGQVVVDL